MFDVLGSNLTPIECASKADLYKAFEYLSAQKAKHRVQNPQPLVL